jgi:predicted metalloprotease
MPAIFNCFLSYGLRIYLILDKITVTNKCLFILQGKEILHQTTSYELVRREDKCEVKTTRLTNQRQYRIKLPDEGMVDDMDPSTERRCPINRNNENVKLVNIDVSDVIKLLKYMNPGISRFFKPNNIH